MAALNGATLSAAAFSAMAGVPMPPSVIIASARAARPAPPAQEPAQEPAQVGGGVSHPG
jgi:hypothetical protein